MCFNFAKRVGIRGVSLRVMQCFFDGVARKFRVVNFIESAGKIVSSGVKGGVDFDDVSV